MNVDQFWELTEVLSFCGVCMGLVYRQFGIRQNKDVYIVTLDNPFHSFTSLQFPVTRGLLGWLRILLDFQRRECRLAPTEGAKYFGWTLWIGLTWSGDEAIPVFGQPI